MLAASNAPAKSNAATSRAISEDAALDDALSNSFPASDSVAMLEPAPARQSPPVVESTVEARSAVTGHNVRYVLGFGIAGVVVAFIVLYFAYHM